MLRVINPKRIIILAIFLLIAWTIWGNFSIETNYYTVSSPKIPNNFKEYKIALITDLHNYKMGENNINLLKIIEQEAPDMIAIVGDLVDCFHTDTEIAIAFASQATEIAPTYYVTGNHEALMEDYTELRNGLNNAGVIVLENESINLEQDGEYIQLVGINDPSFTVNYFTGDNIPVTKDNLNKINLDSTNYSLLLSHRPELFDIYVDYGIDLVLCGHAHGGQFRLPFIGGLYAPDQGILPVYDSGPYTSNDTTMIVSKGLGNSIFPFRFNNRPEIIVIELNTK